MPASGGSGAEYRERNQVRGTAPIRLAWDLTARNGRVVARRNGTVAGVMNLVVSAEQRERRTAAVFIERPGDVRVRGALLPFGVGRFASGPPELELVAVPLALRERGWKKRRHFVGRPHRFVAQQLGRAEFAVDEIPV